MTSCSHCGCPLPVVPPERVVTYLLTTGWEQAVIPSSDHWALMSKDGVNATLEVPLMGQARDYPRRYLELLADLRRIEGRSMAEIAADMNPPGIPESCSGPTEEGFQLVERALGPAADEPLTSSGPGSMMRV